MGQRGGELFSRCGHSRSVLRRYAVDALCVCLLSGPINLMRTWKLYLKPCRVKMGHSFDISVTMFACTFIQSSILLSICPSVYPSFHFNPLCKEPSAIKGSARNRSEYSLLCFACCQEICLSYFSSRFISLLPSFSFFSF